MRQARDVSVEYHDEPLILRIALLPAFRARLRILADLNGRRPEIEAALILHMGIMPDPARAAELAVEDLGKLCELDIPG